MDHVGLKIEGLRKRLKEKMARKKGFEQQMEVIGHLAPHQTVAPLRAYNFSKYEKLVFYDYVPNGSFSALLHGALSKSSLTVGFEWR